MLRSPVLRNLVLLVLFMAGAILAVTAFSARQEQQDLAHLAIEHSRARTDAELERFFGPVEANLGVVTRWGEAELLDLDQTEALNARLIPLLESIPHATSMLIGNTRGEEYLLLRDGETWRNRITRAETKPGVVRWLRWSRTGELLEDDEVALDYDGRGRPWFTGALEDDGASAHWTDPYIFFTTKDPGITASRKWHGDVEDGATWVAALDVMLVDISVFTSGIDVGQTGKVFVLDNAEVVMGLPRDDRFADRDSFKGFVLEPAATLALPELDQALAQWHDEGLGTARFRASNGWWANFHPFPLGDRIVTIGALVPEADFAARANRVRNLTFGITLAALFLAIVMAFVLDRAFQRRLAAEVEKVRQLGQYTLEDKLGSGGMGEVYRASHAMLRRPTAIKLLRGQGADHEHELERFEQEVQLTAQLTHPNTIAIYDYGRTPENVFYYAMEYVGGLDMVGLVQRDGPLPPERVIFLLKQVCGSLQEAHEVGLVHRDVKPANIMVCERGGKHDVVKVLDFGLVTDLQQDSGDTSNPRGIIGTPKYMSPEALQSPDRIDGRSDLYAVGAIGVYLLTGRHAFEGGSVAEVCAAHIHGEHLVPSEVVPGVPADLERVLMAALSLQPSDRPTSAAELALRLDMCDDARGWNEERAGSWWKRYGKGPTRTKVEVTRTEQTFSLTVNLDERAPDESDITVT
ncbi:MAG: protein kinase [Proteobacteria bacterium]|nr:protein kinase [Pseudomonadota bacterium]